MSEPQTVIAEETPAATTVPVLPSVDEYLKLAQQYDCSDLHLATASPPMWRRYGTLGSIWENGPVFTAEDTRRLSHAFLTPQQTELLEKRGDVDFAYSPEFGRFRCSVVQQRLGIDMAFRIINTSIRSMEDLGLPEVCRTLTRYQ